MDVMQRLVGRLDLSDYEREVGADGVERWWRDLTWQFISFSKAKWLERASGIWSITEAGIQKLRSSTPEAAFQEAQQAYRDWKATETDEEDFEAVGEEPIAQRIWLIGAGPSASWWPDFQRKNCQR